MTKLSLRTEGARDVVITRPFAAPPAMVYRAHTEPGLIRQWMLGFDGWTMPVCTTETRPGGAFHFEWDDGQGGGMKITGEYLELDPGSRILHVERMYMPDPTPDNRIETVFAPQGSGTLMTMRMTLPDEVARTAMLEFGMEDGMEESYAKLDALKTPFALVD